MKQIRLTCNSCWSSVTSRIYKNDFSVHDAQHLIFFRFLTTFLTQIICPTNQWALKQKLQKYSRTVRMNSLEVLSSKINLFWIFVFLPHIMSPSLSKTADDFLLCPHSFEKKKKEKRKRHWPRNITWLSQYKRHFLFRPSTLPPSYEIWHWWFVVDISTYLTHALLDLTSRNLDHSENISKTSDKHKSSIPAWRKNTIDIDSECQIND